MLKSPANRQHLLAAIANVARRENLGRFGRVAMTTRVTFERGTFRDFVEWATVNKKIHQRIVSLILDILRQPTLVVHEL